MTELELLKQHYQRRDQTAREWKESGGKVAGYIGVDVPEEFLLAAGFFPLRVTGNPAGSTALAEKYVRATFNPEVRSMFNRLLDGTYAFLDHLIIPNSTEFILRLFYCLREIKRLEPYPGMPDFYFFEFLHTKFRTSALYNYDRVRDFKKQLEEWIGKEITDDALREAIAVCNENRRLLQEIAQLRIEAAPRISGVEALQIIGTSMFMPKADHNKLLRQLLNKADQLPTRDGVRLFIEGSSIDNTRFYEIVESYKATIVAEDSDWGNRYFDTLVDETIAPLEAITDRYHTKAPSPTKSGIQERVDYCVRKAVEANVDGVIFFILHGENPPSWDYPEQREALEARGIATLCLPWQPYALTDTEELKASIETFIETITSGDRRSSTGKEEQL